MGSQPWWIIAGLVAVFYTVAVVAVGVVAAFVLVGQREVPREAPQDVSFATRAARADLYGDAINDGLVVGPSKQLTSGLVTFDRSVVDGLFSGGATAVAGIGILLRRVQNGFVHTHSVVMNSAMRTVREVRMRRPV